MAAIQSAFPPLLLSGGTLTGPLTISAASNAPLLALTNTQAAPTSPTLQVTSAAAAYKAVGVQVAADAFERWQVDSTGREDWGTGAAAVDAGWFRSAIALLTSNSSLSLNTLARGFRTKEGANAKQGTAVLVAGTVTVADTSVTATSRIFLTSQVDGGAPGFLRITAVTAGVSFVITSSSGTDTSTVAYEIYEPG